MGSLLTDPNHSVHEVLNVSYEISTFLLFFFFKKFFHLVWKSKRKMKVKQNLSFNLKWLFYLLISEKYQRNTI